MTRFARFAASAVLVALSVCAQASAAFSPLPSEGAVRLEPARMFDPAAESLLAFVMPQPPAMSYVSETLFNLPPPSSIELPGAGAAIPAPAGAGVAKVRLAIPALHVAAYVPSYVPPAPSALPALTQPHINAAPQAAPPLAAAQAPDLAAQVPAVHFGTYVPYAPALKGVGEGATLPVRVGGVHFEGAFRAMQVCGTADEGAACASQQNARAQNFTAGTNFNVRAGNSDVKVQISSSIEHLTNEAAGIFPYVPLDADAQAGLSYYGLTDVVKHGVNAQLAVPVSSRITVGLQYDRAHYQGDYNSTLLPGFDARKDTYLGNVTYQLPNTSSAITFSARQYRYQDAFAPDFNLKQTRADLNFTVKF